MGNKAWWEEDDWNDTLGTEPEAGKGIEIEETSGRDIAIIGMAVRLPQADDVDAFWDRITEGYDAVGPFPEARRADAEALLAGTKLPEGTIAYYDGAYLEEIDKFDCRFFRLSPKEAALMNPNQRLWLETAWSAIENAGYGGSKLSGSRTGVYLGYNGDAFHDYKRLIAEKDPASLSLAIPGNLSSIVAGRLSYLLDLQGPAITVDTACSSSLAALHLAVQALRSGECETAIVGGVKTYLLPVDLGIKIGIESSDSKARTFDDASDGTGGGEGAAAVLLKPLGQALRDRDAIYAVIKGTASNQDGASVGITAPNVLAQEAVIANAWQDAAIDPGTIGYIEAHGTGTKLGDPIEIAGLSKAFRRYTDRSQFCAVGSLKTNYGHLDTTAGLVGLIKAVMALHSKQLPPMLHFRAPNREISFVDSPVYVSDMLRPWEQEGDVPRRAGVSSFGMSGTNVHAVLEEAPDVEPVYWEDDENLAEVLALSARTEAALGALVGRYARFLEQPEGRAANLRDVCYTANTGRGHYEYRAALTASSVGELQGKLARLEQRLRGAALFGDSSQTAWRSEPGVWAGRLTGGGEREPWTDERLCSASPETLCREYAEGGSLDWAALYAGSSRRRVHLPTYPFERIRCWVEESPASARYRIPDKYAAELAVRDSSRELEPVSSVVLSGREEAGYSETERAVAETWGRVLGVSTIGVNDHYYELGGDSILGLQITSMLSARFDLEVGVAELVRYPSVAALAEYIDGATSNTADRASVPAEVVRSASDEVFALSRSQIRLYLAAQQPGADVHHHMTLAYVVEGPLDADRLQTAFSSLAKRHESLRTTFEWSEEGEPIQRVHPEAEVKVERAMFSSEEEWPSYVAGFVQPFDLTRLPLLRIGLASVSAERHLLVLDTHHLIADGASLALLLQELTSLYDGRSLPAKGAEYRDYVRLQRERMESEAMRRMRAYWLEDALAGPLPELRLPLDFPRPATKKRQGRLLRFTISAVCTEKLHLMAKRRQASVHTVLFSIYGLLMNRYSGQDELIVGSLVNGREQREFRDVVGLFMNFLPVRIRVREEESFADLLEDVGRLTLQAYDNGQFPFDEMIAGTNAGSNRSRNPLYDTMLVFHNHAAGSEKFTSGGLQFTELPLDRETSALDVKMDLFPGASGELRGVIEYDTALFREETIARMATHFVQLAEAVSGEEDPQLGALELFEPGEGAELERRRKLNDGEAQTQRRRLSVRIASTFTSEPVAKPLKQWLAKFGYRPEITFAPYNQIFQFLTAIESEPNDNAVATVLLVRAEDWLSPQSAGSEDALARLDDDLERLAVLLKSRADQGPHFVALMPFDNHGPLAAMPEESTRRLRERWTASLTGAAHVHLLDFADTAARYRVRRIEDPVAFEVGRIPYTEDYYAAFGTEIARAWIGWNGHPFKVIVVDADNTLWRGVCGEDGPTGVVVSPPFEALQRLLLRKRSEGFLLALCSKNNETDLWETFERNTGMVLRQEHFAAWRVNWNPKSGNVRELAEELNLGVDSFMFIDDNAAECMAMMAECPEVLTLKLPEEAEISSYLAHVWAWDRLRVTEEDRNRAAGYEAERRRQADARSGSGEALGDYLRSLQLKVSLRPLAPDETERAAQLTVRTNQFNLNGVRYTEAEIKRLMQEDRYRPWIVEAADRYGEYGRIGFVAAEVRGSALAVDAFLLSCRVLGRGVEQTVLAGLKRYAQENACAELRASFRRTAKNRPFEQFIAETGWKPEGKETPGAESQDVTYVIQTNHVAEVPAHVEYFEGVRLAAEEALGETAAAETERGDLTWSSPHTWTAGKDDAEVAPEPYRWVLPSIQEKMIVHNAYLLPLRYPDASDIAELAMEWQEESKSASTDLLYEAPVGETEIALAKLWERILGGGTYGRNDHFFDAGGDSLQAAALVSQIVRTFGVRVTLIDLFDHPRLSLMAKLIAGLGESGRTNVDQIPKAPEAELYPVSPAQRRMYFLQQFDPAGTAYQIPTVLRLSGAIDRAKMKMAFRKLAERHEALRTSFELYEGEPCQRIHPEAVVDWTEAEAAEGEAFNEAIRAFVQPFELRHAPLFRVGLFRQAADRHTLAFDIHHIVADGVSVNVLVRDFIRLYGGEELPPLARHYRDYAVWQQSAGQKARIEEQLGWWTTRFAGPIPKLELHGDAPRPAVKSTAGSQLILHLNKEQTAELNRLAQRSGTTLFMLLLSAYAVWLAKLSRQPEVVIGTPVAGRTHPDTESMVGVFVNALPVRIAAAPNQAFRGLLAAVKTEVLGLLGRQDAPFEDLVERLQPTRDMTRNPLFDAMFSMLNMAHAELSAPGITALPVPFDFGVSQFDIGLYVVEEDTGLTITVQYASAIYGERTMQHWTDALRTLLHEIVRKPEAELGELELLMGEERQRIVDTFNDTQAPYPDSLTLQEMFRRQAARTPERIAAAFADERLTYRELDARADRIARRLLEAGLAPEEAVGLMAERSAAMMAGMLGILKAGGAYVPLPPDFPADRLRFMTEDCGLRIVLSQRQWIDVAELAAPNATTIDLDEPETQATALTTAQSLLPEGSSEQLAYILYTSGSTGRPKGVMIRHRSVVNRLNWMQKAYPLQQDDVILQKTPYSFDVSVWELFWWAMAGASVAFLEPSAEKDPSRLIEAIGRHRATTMHFVPSMLAAFLEAAQAEPRERLRELLGSLRRVFASGEALQRAHVDRFYALMRELELDHVRLVNLYGPTEATVDVSVYECEANSSLDFVPIGRPIDNTSLYVVSSEGLAQPVGVPGELCIGGVQLAKGYVNRPDLTAEKFVPNPFKYGELMYRTGDLARWMEDGQVQYLGRIDDQVKIRGYRIELGEIERTLLLHEAVSEAVAVVRDDVSGGKRICAYVVADRSLTSGELRRHCAERLPDYMIPAAFAQLTVMPLTASGKADRKALPEPEEGTMDTGTAYAAPAGETERKLAALWEELLQRERIGANDDFFELGGHSLKAAAMAARIETEFGVRLPLKDIFLHPTVSELAAHLTIGTAHAAHEPIPPAPVKPYYPVTSMQQQMLVHERRNPGTLSYHMPAILVINGALDESRLHFALQRLTERHEALRTSFDQAEGRMVQRIHDRVDIAFERIEPAAFFADDDVDEIQAARRWLKPFDLSQAPLFRTAIVPQSEDRHLFLFDIHHLVSDGISSSILIADLAAMYEGQPLPTVQAQFKDYSEWLADRLSGKEKERHIRYWSTRFSDGVPALELPADEDRSALVDPQARDEAGQYRFRVPEEMTERLGRLARRSGATLSMVLLASYQALLGYWSGSEDVVTGLPAAGRSHSNLSRTTGLLLQTFAIRNRPARSLSFESWLAEVKRSMLEAFDHPWLPMDELIEKLDEQGLIRWDATRHPLFDTMFVMNNFEQPPSGSGELRWEPLDWPVIAAKTDLVLQAEERDGSLHMVLEYRSRLLREETVREMADALLAFLDKAAEDPGSSLESLTGASSDPYPTADRQEEVPAGTGGLFDTGFSF